MTIGADRAFPTEKGVNPLGGFADIGREERQLDYHGNGSTSDIAVGVTLTLLRHDGWFAGLIGKLGRQGKARA